MEMTPASKKQVSALLVLKPFLLKLTIEKRCFIISLSHHLNKY